jgi:hypothetical protein
MRPPLFCVQAYPDCGNYCGLRVSLVGKFIEKLVGADEPDFVLFG